MGCYFAIYEPSTDDYDFNCSYSTFSAMRIEIARAALDSVKDDFFYNLEGSIFSGENYWTLLDKMKTYGFYGIKKLLNHSDCDGTYSSEDARDILFDYEKVKEYLVDSELFDWIKSLMSTFKRVCEVDGLVLIC